MSGQEREKLCPRGFWMTPSWSWGVFIKTHYSVSLLPQYWSQAVVRISTPRMYPRCRHILVKCKINTKTPKTNLPSNNVQRNITFVFYFCLWLLQPTYLLPFKWRLHPQMFPKYVLELLLFCFNSIWAFFLKKMLVNGTSVNVDSADICIEIFWQN